MPKKTTASIRTAARSAAALLLFGVLIPGACQPCLAGHTAEAVPIAVELASGRSFTATLELGDDAEHLWLRWQKGQAVLLRPVRWERVVRAEVAGETLDRDELRQLVERMRAETPFEPEPAAEDGVIVMRGASRVSGSVPAPPPPPEAPPVPRVRSLAVDAVAANWDGDVETDGLVLHVSPLDAQGRLVPVRGRLEVELIGQPDRLVLRRRRPFERLEYWTQQLRPEDFGPYEAVVRLPFGRVHPEFDTDVAPLGAVHVRFSVPGQGTFESTASMVRIRPYSAVRDRLEQTTGHRFFPGERTGDGRR